MLISPEQVATTLPNRPILTSQRHSWAGMVLQRYQYTTFKVEIPAIRDHALVLRLSGQALIEEKRESGRTERFWTDSSHISLTPVSQPVSKFVRGRSDILIIHLCQSIVMGVVETVFDRDPASVSLCPRFAFPEKQIDLLGRMLLAEAEAGGTGTVLAADMLAQSLALHLVRRHSNLSPAITEQAPPILGGRLRRVVEFIRAHLSEELRLSELAVISGLSQSQFARAFREAVGDPPYRYIITLRMERARDLLENSKLSVIEIGLECGFDQPTHFASMFRKCMGMSPRSWRQACRS